MFIYLLSILNLNFLKIQFKIDLDLINTKKIKVSDLYKEKKYGENLNDNEEIECIIGLKFV